MNMVAGKVARWVPHRVGLVNYWYYDEEEFQFADGKLLLRGGNGSGKSVTMQSLIPLLLDGNKSPERLDPFGSRARQIQDYLLGDEDRRIDQRTGYLFMEFKRKGLEQYLTIGIGLQARRHQPVDSWGFAITDGRRIGHDFELYKPGLRVEMERAKVPLAKRELKELLGEGGVFTTTPGEYMALINQLVFGFASLDEYDELIKLLIQLRSPKLSKDFRPSVLYDIMNSSLQALSDEDLRPLTETIENMDQMRTQLDELKRNRKAALKIASEYDRYNRAVLYNKALAYKKAEENLKKTENAIGQNEALLLKEAGEVAELEQGIIELEQERETLQAKERELKADDAFDLEEKYQNQLQRKERLEQEIKNRETNLTQKIAREKDLERQAQRAKLQGEFLENKTKDELTDMENQADLARFDEHSFGQSDLHKVWGGRFDFAPWQRDTKRYQDRLKIGRLALEEAVREERRYDECLQTQDLYEKEHEQALKYAETKDDELDHARQAYLTDVAAWYGENTEFQLTGPERQILNQLILDYGEGKNNSDLEKHLFPIFRNLDQNSADQILKKRHHLKNLEAEEMELSQELLAWQTKADPEPERDEIVVATRRLLKDAGISHLPFYEAVDFKADVPPEAQGVLEAVFSEMGVLDALVVPAKELARAQSILGQGADKLLLASPKAEAGKLNLHHVLEIVCPPGELFNAVQNILASFALRQGQMQEALTWSLTEGGSFSLGQLVGQARTDLPARFVGVAARRRYREEKMQNLEEQLALLKSELYGRQKELQKLEDARQRLEWEYGSLPRQASLDVAVSELNRANREVLLLSERLGRQIKLVQEQFASLQVQKNSLREKTKGLSLPPTLPKFVEAEEEMQGYVVALTRLESNYQQWITAVEGLQGLEIGLFDLRDDVDYLRGELNISNQDLRGCLRFLGELEVLRERDDFKRLQAEIEHIIRRLRSIPDEIKQKAARQGHLEGHLVTLRQELAKEREGLGEVSRNRADAEGALRSEFKLGFVTTLPTPSSSPDLPESILFLAEAVLSILAKEVSQASFDEILLTRRLQEAVYEQRSDLLEFGLTIGELVKGNEEAASNRLEVTARLEGRIVSLYQLAKWIEQEIQKNESLLDDADRELFEEIIMQTVGQKIRAKIYRAEEWVQNMNRLMAERDTTSGLTLHLQWRPKAAETEEELGTKELVEILKTDVSILSETIFNQVTTHFRSQVQRAKTRLEEQDFRQSFHQVIQDVLDYRKWFEFKLLFQKTGETRKELTNRAFDRLSGGEKAMAMYIPLFSSVYSRYQAARADAPRLISLDEAFAGVDDSNIRDMFQLLEQLGFDYIINSQILWGDYDTVSNLSICELVRPKNAEHVSVVRYHWDGKCRSLLLDGTLEAAANGGADSGSKRSKIF